MPSGPSHDEGREHRFIICNEPCEDGFVLLLPISGWSNDLCDPTCKIEQWAHPPLTKDSYVFYRQSRIESVETIAKGIETGVLCPCEDVNTALFLKATNGILRSKQTKKNIKKYWNTLKQ